MEILKQTPKQIKIIQIKEISAYKQTMTRPVHFSFKIGGDHCILSTVQTKMLHICNLDCN